ncbi:phosphoribosyl-AMP cyclohydrolase [Klebsiella pneumoniae]|uniref:Phosphoribosyl-AMP cyclohydrolase n=1 Tax=Klebsiella pneumoniae TaxID=573 RepID=A0A377TVM3_KLEPN|nr:phosphoribosyl-AMP cyclohydrolase [Klebsiella pneumoniae]
MLTEQLDWEKTDGMMPAIVQHAVSGEVLMHGYMNKEALEKTEATGKGYLLLAHQAAAVDQG